MNYWLKGIRSWLPVVFSLSLLVLGILKFDVLEDLLKKKEYSEDVTSSLSGETHSKSSKTNPSESMNSRKEYESVAKSKFQLRGVGENLLYFMPNEKKPYDGWLKEQSEDGILEVWKVQNGSKHGEYSTWYENGQKCYEVYYEFGKKRG